MLSNSNRPPGRILIASANPLFSKGLQKLFVERWSDAHPEMRLANSMAATLNALENWSPDLVVVDYDDRNINRAEFLNHFMAGVEPMQVMLVSLQESGEVVVYDRRTLTPDQARDWFEQEAPRGAAAFEAPDVEQLRTVLPVESKKAESFFTWRWMLTTLLVLIVIGVFIRLGFWQLDRLAQRRALNARMQAQISAPELDLNRDLPAASELEQMEYRSAVVTGTFDPAGEVVLRNRVWQNQLGVHVLTPLRIQGSTESILVDRGWIPFKQAGQTDRARYQQTGVVTVHGMLRGGETKPTYVAPAPTLAPGETHQDAWNYLDLAAINNQEASAMLPVYLQAAPDPAFTGLPYRSLTEIDLTEGPHLGYAIQWFAFALILALGYPYFVRRQIAGRHEHQTVSGTVRN